METTVAPDQPRFPCLSCSDVPVEHLPAEGLDLADGAGAHPGAFPIQEDPTDAAEQVEYVPLRFHLPPSPSRQLVVALGPRGTERPAARALDADAGRFLPGCAHPIENFHYNRPEILLFAKADEFFRLR